MATDETALTPSARSEELPTTSSFLAVEPLPALPMLGADAAGLLRALALVWVAEVGRLPLPRGFFAAAAQPTSLTASFRFRPTQPPTGLTCAHAAQLQAWLPPGGSRCPGDWTEVYRATTDGFSAAAFHARCDRRPRLLVLVRALEGNWLFGGFTAVGFIPPMEESEFVFSYADPDAFLFSLTNSLGRPEKLESKRTGVDLSYDCNYSATFGSVAYRELQMCDDADSETGSYTRTRRHFAEPASDGAHPMARGLQGGWRAAEVLAWAV